MTCSSFLFYHNLKDPKGSSKAGCTLFNFFCYLQLLREGCCVIPVESWVKANVNCIYQTVWFTKDFHHNWPHVLGSQHLIKTSSFLVVWQSTKWRKKIHSGFYLWFIGHTWNRRPGEAHCIVGYSIPHTLCSVVWKNLVGHLAIPRIQKFV